MALGLVENELRRARERGFTAEEVREVTSAQLAGLRASVADFSGDHADKIANGIAPILAADREWHGPAAVLAIAENLFASFTPAMAAERLQATFPENQLQIVLLSPQPISGGADAVLAAYRASSAKPLTADSPKSESELRFPYDDFGPPGAIAERRWEAPLGIELIRFANGARLNLRPSGLEPKRFRIWARLGRGTADIPRELPGINLLAIALMGKSDLGRMTRDDLWRLTSCRAVEGSWTFDDNDFVIQLTGPSAALPFALRSLTAYLADVKLEPAKLLDALSSYPALTAEFVNSTSGSTKVERRFRVTGEDPRFRLPPVDEVKRYSFETVAGWMRTHWLEGPIEVGIAGDFKADDAIAAAAASIGALSRRHEPPAAERERTVFLGKPYRNLTFINLPDKTASVSLFWPVRDAGDLRVFRALRVAAAALEDGLRVTLRQNLGATYAPSGGVFRAADQPDFGFISVDVTFDPSKAQKMAERAIKLADNLARHGLTKEEFARLREPLRAAALEDLRSDEWWLANVLIRAQSQPAVLAEARTHGTAYDDLSRDEVNRAAASHLVAAKSNAVGYIPQAALPSTK
jgi:zinc protease